jgi:flagellar biosynthesis protein FlhG
VTSVPQPADQAAGLRAMQNRNAPLPLSATRCIAIGSGKGGVGKTVVSIGLSLALSEMGRRVLLFDGDMGLANVDLQLGLIPEFTLQDVLFGQCEMAQACQSVENGPDVLLSASGAPELVDISDARRRLFIEDLFRFAARYEYFIVDTGAGIGRSTTDFLAACPEVLVVLTNEPTSLMDAYALIKTLHLRATGQGLGVVVNMVDSLDEGEALFGRLDTIARQFIGASLSLEGVIVYDRRVSEAIRSQRSIVRYAANGRVAHCLRDLAAKLVSRPRRSAPRPEMEHWLSQWEFSEFLNNGSAANS